ncbi:MAG: hypothetical protein WCO52_00525 [bacterium]
MSEVDTEAPQDMWSYIGDKSVVLCPNPECQAKKTELPLPIEIADDLSRGTVTLWCNVCGAEVRVENDRITGFKVPVAKERPDGTL